MWRYTWDAAGRLATVDMPDKRRIISAYDPLERRLEARTLGPRGGKRLPLERTRFVWDGDSLVHSIRTVGTAPPIETRTFCFDDGGFVPRAQCMTRPDALHGVRCTWVYFVNDPVGTPDELVTDRGAGDKERAWSNGRDGGISHRTGCRSARPAWILIRRSP